MNEPGAGIIELSLMKDTITISTYSMNKPSYDLNTEIENEMKNIEECEYSIAIDKIELVDSVVAEYSLYEKGNGRCYYEINWDDFPQSEYNELKRIVFEANKNLSKINSLQSCNFLKL